MKTRKFLIVFLTLDNTRHNCWFETQSPLSQQLIESAAQKLNLPNWTVTLIQELEA